MKAAILEKKGAIVILITLRKHGDLITTKLLKETKLGNNVFYGALRILYENGLITKEKKEDKYPYSILISLTDRGRKVAEKLLEIEDILEK